jgi:hypothetical protein
MVRVSSLVAIGVMAISFSAISHELQVPHFDLEMSSEEYRQHLRTLPREKFNQPDHPAITEALKVGERLQKWISHINSGRAPGEAIRLTSQATRRGTPIERPNSYSPLTIQNDMARAMQEMPVSLRRVINSSGAFPSELPVSDEHFITHGRKLDRLYQSAARYKSLDRFRAHYIRAQARDVRGYHYLVSHKITARELRDVSLIPAKQEAPIRSALTTLCLNTSSENLNSCTRKVADAFAKNTLSAFYESYFPMAKANWESFFNIPASAVRSDVTWRGNVARVPFITPAVSRFIPYLQHNIEDEFKWGAWGLKLNFGQFKQAPMLVLRPGVVPHVNRLGGNEIVMDANQPIEEYESQWTIRHEFGHVLGLPDCYHEFFDEGQQVYVNYQLDITDLMCSRAGDMNERIFQELKRVYKK